MLSGRQMLFICEGIIIYLKTIVSFNLQVEEYPRISLVTPNFNQDNFLEQTICSVLDQGYPNLEYIIVDGGSTDRSIEIIKKYSSKLSWWISEKDEGMYHAIQKGFDKSTGEIMGWINSDDVLQGESLYAVAKCFRQKEVNWVQGINTVIDIEGRILYIQKPYNTSWYDFLCYNFLVNGKLKRFGTLQQESTFWRRVLWRKADGLDLRYKYAGDFALWMIFFRYDKLFLVDSPIGAFRIRPDQISEKRIEQYIDEAKACVQEEINRLDDSAMMMLRKYKRYSLTTSNFLRWIMRVLDKDYKILSSLGNNFVQINKSIEQ